MEALVEDWWHWAQRVIHLLKCFNVSPHRMTPSVKVEKMHTIQKMDGALQKSAAGSTCSSSVSSSVKTGLNWQSIPKPPLPSPGQIPNGKGILSTPPNVEKKAEDSNCRKYLHKRLSGMCKSWYFFKGMFPQNIKSSPTCFGFVEAEDTHMFFHYLCSLI